MHNSPENSDSESSCDSTDRITAETGLSSLALEALSSFLNPSDLDSSSDALPDPIAKETICQAYTPGDNAMIASTLKRLQEKDEQKRLEAERLLASATLKGEVYDESINPSPLPHTPSILSPVVISRKLEVDGCVKLLSVLSPSLCSSLLSHIDNLLESDNSEKFGTNNFGNVLVRKNRFDMYLSKDDQIVSSSLSHLLNNSSTLGKLFENIFKKKSCPFHELSSLISDPGAPSQPLHPDSKWSDVPILYTVFVALQDVTETMGPTVFIPKSNREEIHKQHASRLPITMDRFSGQMKAGDCVVMDSRTLHHGSANNDLEKNRRRRLLYFTIRNPEYGGAFPSNGSLFEGMTCSTGEFNIPQPNTPP